MSDADPTESQPPPPGRGLGSILRHSLNYSVVPIVHKLLAVAMLPLFTEWLSTAEYGAVFVTDVVLMVMAELFGAHLLNGMLRFYFEQRGERERRAVVSSTTLAAMGVSALVCGLGLVFREQLAPILLGRGDAEVGPADLIQVLALAMCTLPFALTSQSGFYYLQIQKRSGLHSGIKLAKMVIELSLKVVAVGFLGWGVAGYFLSVLIGEALTSIFLTGWVLWQVGPRFDWKILKPILRYTLPLVPVGLCQLGIHQIDRRLLEALSPQAVALSYVGIYGLGYTVGAMANQMVNAPFFTIWQPWIFSERDPAQRAALMSRVTTYAVVVVTAASLGLTVYGREAVIVLTSRQEFHNAYLVVPWITAGYVFWALYASSQLSYYIERNTRSLVAVNLAALVVNLFLDVALIPTLGYVGAAAASLVTYAVLAFCAMDVGRRVSPIPFERRRLFVTLTTMLVGCALTLAADVYLSEAGLLHWTAALGLKTVLLVLLLGVLWQGVLRNEERRSLIGWVRSKLVSAQG